MQKTTRPIASLAAIIISACIWSGSTQAQDYNWKLTSYVTVKTGTWNLYMQKFIDAAHLFTGGKVKIKGFSVGVLAGPFDGWDAVRKGTADICFCYPGFAVNKDPANGIFGGMVGGMPMEEFMHWAIAADGGKLLVSFRGETQQLHSVVTGMGSTEFFLHSHRKVQSLADLKGMKIRTAGPWADILKQIGASPTVLPPTEIYTALERRVIDGTEFITPATNLKIGFHKIAKFIIVPGIHSPSHMNEAVFRQDVWKSLPSELQKQLTAAGNFAALQSAMQGGVADIAAIEKLTAGRNEWVTLDAAAQQTIEDLGRAWSADQAKKQAAKGNPWMDRVSKSYWGFYDRWKKFGTYRHN